MLRGVVAAAAPAAAAVAARHSIDIYSSSLAADASGYCSNRTLQSAAVVRMLVAWLMASLLCITEISLKRFLLHIG